MNRKAKEIRGWWELVLLIIVVLAFAHTWVWSLLLVPVWLPGLLHVGKHWDVWEK